ncbi:MAG: polysaccharide pyruvyl transferase family protein [Eubacterium sp.]
MNKKIGILTFHRSENYGSVLQAYALSKSIDKICGNGTAEIIDFSNRNQRDLYAIFLKSGSVKNIVKNCRAALNYAQLKRRKKGFTDFIEHTLPIGSEQYLSEDDIHSSTAVYDKIICGSDQIWNPQSQDFSMSFFGVDFDCPKSSYAPSIRNASIEDFNGYEDSIINALASFDRISLREKNSIPVFNQLTDKKIDCVCDPTLLLSKEDYNEICPSNPLPKEYIFYYSIDYNKQSVEMVKCISKRLSLPVVILFTTNKTYNVYFKGFKLSKNNSPGDFINLIKNAKLVLSTSFHGTAFSVIYRKNFFALKTNNYTDARIDDLLTALNLSNRYLDYNSYQDADLNIPVKYDEAAIEDMINYSKNYLFRCLND